MIKRLRLKSEFGSNVLTLMTGTTIAQAIPVALSPILTRIYTPEDFGVLALYMAVSSLITVVASARYELAVMQPKEDEDALSLVVLSILIATVISLILFAIVHFLNDELQLLLGGSAIGVWLYLIPVSVFVTGFYRALNYWNSRNKSFQRIAYSKVAQGVGGVGAQVGLGYANILGGLIVGYLVGQIAALWILLTKFLREDKRGYRITAKKIIENAKRYIKYPKYSMFGAFSDAASLQMPVLMLGKFYDLHATGMFSLTFKVLNLPMSLISTALSQVLYQKVVEMHHQAPSRIYALILKIFLFLLTLMVPFVIFIWLYGDSLFAFVFGEPWREAGNMAAILVIAVAIRFAVSPLSIVLAMDHNIKLGVLWQFIYLATITTTLYIFSGQDMKTFLVAFVIHEVALYLLYFTFILKAAKYVNGD